MGTTNNTYNVGNEKSKRKKNWSERGNKIAIKKLLLVEEQMFENFSFLSCITPYSSSV